MNDSAKVWKKKSCSTRSAKRKIAQIDSYYPNLQNQVYHKLKAYGTTAMMSSQ